MRNHNHNRDRDWKTAGEECLTAALDRAKELIDKAEDHKSLESLIKTVSEVVGFGAGVGRSVARAGASGGDDDE